MPYFNPQFKRGQSRSSFSHPSWLYSYNRSLDFLDNNDNEAFRLNAIAAKQGMHDAVLAMGWFYLNGIGVKADLQEAIRWYRKSARQGDTSAMFSLGYIAYTRRDFPEALTWFSRAVGKGHHRSKFWIGKLYWRGQSVQQDRKRALDLFNQAAAHKVVEAQRSLRFLAHLTNRHSNSQI